MNDLVLRLLPNSRRALSGACPSCRRERIPITAPEALALADDLRGCQRMGTIQRVRAAAQRNLQASNVPGDSSDDSICPLYCSSGCCLTHAARPLFCRGRDFADDGTRSTKSPIQQDAEQSLGTALGVGMLSGLAGALQAANHDGGVYELNSALLTALDVPDAARRWAHGEPVFATCATVDVVM